MTYISTSGIEVEALTNRSVVFSRQALNGPIARRLSASSLVVMDTRRIVGTSTSGTEVEVG